jgi:hypothetical protein
MPPPNRPDYAMRVGCAALGGVITMGSPRYVTEWLGLVGGCGFVGEGGEMLSCQKIGYLQLR